LSDEKLLAVVKNDLSVFSEDEKLVIELADEMANTPANVSDELYARLRAKFSEEQLLQLGGQIAFENYRARLNRVFDVGSDELYQPQKAHKAQNKTQPTGNSFCALCAFCG
jgi:alkylhydroperoxidase family enzyme